MKLVFENGRPVPQAKRDLKSAWVSTPDQDKVQTLRGSPVMSFGVFAPHMQDLSRHHLEQQRERERQAYVKSILDDLDFLK